MSKGMKGTVAMLGMVAVALAAVPSADAASIKVSCEKRATRSRASVDGNDLRPGAYQARITSGGNEAMSLVEATVGDEVQFDFDSRRADIAEGATAIPRNFIQGDPATVTGEILDGAGQVVASATAVCRVRR